MSELAEKVKESIARIKNFDPLSFSQSGAYYLAFSGGKDSVVCKALLDMAGVKYDGHYSVTSVDPPELVQFIKDKYAEVSRDIPRYSDYGGGAYRGDEWIGKQITMWNLIPWLKIPPIRQIRYCCDYLKESSGDGRLTVTGVRWEESFRRKRKHGFVTVYGKIDNTIAESPYFRLTGNRGAVLVNDNAESREMIDACVTRSKTCLNPIIDWTNAEVWEFIKAEKIPYCELYDCGFKRLGCIGCPMGVRKQRMREFAIWPKYKAAYLRAFKKMIIAREGDKQNKRVLNNRFNTPEEVYHWWIQDDVLPNQEILDEFAEEWA